MESQTRTIQFAGQMVARDKGHIPVFARVRYDEADLTKLEVELGRVSKRRSNASIQAEIGAHKERPITIRNSSNENGTLTLENVYGVGGSEDTTDVRVSSFSYGFSGRFVNSKDVVYLTYRMVPSGILGGFRYKEMNLDGGIRIRRNRFKDPYWATAIGEFVCSETHQFFKDETSSKPRDIVEPCTTVVLKYHPQRRQELRKIRDEASKFVQNIQTLLCLCSRRRVRLYAIDASVVSSRERKEPRIPYVSPLQRFCLHRGEDASDYDLKDPLLELRNISGKKFHKLAESLRSSELEDDLKTAIHFLTISRTGYLEEGYFFCFAALDSLTDAVLGLKGRRLGLPKNMARDLRNQISKVIDATDLLENESLKSEIKSKLPELTRVPMKAKIAEVVDLLKVQTDDLWNPQSFADGIKDAVKIRNDLFHGAKVSSYPGLSSNLVRLQFLTERMILRALSWNMKNIWVWNDQELKLTNIP